MENEGLGEVDESEGGILDGRLVRDITFAADTWAFPSSPDHFF